MSLRRDPYERQLPPRILVLHTTNSLRTDIDSKGNVIASSGADRDAVLSYLDAKLDEWSEDLRQLQVTDITMRVMGFDAVVTMEEEVSTRLLTRPNERSRGSRSS